MDIPSQNFTLLSVRNKAQKSAAFALERSLAICHPLYTLRHPALKNSPVYLICAIAFSFAKDIGWYTNFICNFWGIKWESESRDYTVLLMFSVLLTFVSVTVMTVLCVLTICKLQKPDPDRILVRQNSRTSRASRANTNIERKLVIIGVINTILGIISEMAMWIIFVVSWATYKCPSCLTFTWCLWILNNVLNFPVYLAIFHCGCGSLQMKIQNIQI